MKKLHVSLIALLLALAAVVVCTARAGFAVVALEVPAASGATSIPTPRTRTASQSSRFILSASRNGLYIVTFRLLHGRDRRHGKPKIFPPDLSGPARHPGTSARSGSRRAGPEPSCAGAGARPDPVASPWQGQRLGYTARARPGARIAKATAQFSRHLEA